MTNNQILLIIFSALATSFVSHIDRVVCSVFKSKRFGKIKRELLEGLLGILACGCFFAAVFVHGMSDAFYITLAASFCVLLVLQYRLQKFHFSWALEQLLVELFIGGIVFSVVLSKLSEAVR